MGKKDLNPVQKYRKNQKKQAYERAEKDRIKARREMKKSVDEDKIHQRLEFIAKEEAAGRMTYGMRNEKNQLSMQLKTITKKTKETDYKFMPKQTINQMKGPKGRMRSTFSYDQLDNRVEPNVDVPKEVEHDSSPGGNAPNTNPIVSEECPTPSSSEPAFNPFAVRSTPISVGHIGDSTFKPSSLRRRTHPSQPDKPTFSVDNNPIAASLLTSLVPPPPPPPEEDMEDFDQDEEAEAEAEAEAGISLTAPQVSVPGPQLRFTLVPYGLEDSDSSDNDAAVPPPPPPQNEDQEDNDDAFNQFMADIASL